MGVETPQRCDARSQWVIEGPQRCKASSQRGIEAPQWHKARSRQVVEASKGYKARSAKFQKQCFWRIAGSQSLENDVSDASRGRKVSKTMFLILYPSPFGDFPCNRGRILIDELLLHFFCEEGRLIVSLCQNIYIDESRF